MWCSRIDFFLLTILQSLFMSVLCEVQSVVECFFVCCQVLNVKQLRKELRIGLMDVQLVLRSLMMERRLMELMDLMDIRLESWHNLLTMIVIVVGIERLGLMGLCSPRRFQRRGHLIGQGVRIGPVVLRIVSLGLGLLHYRHRRLHFHLGFLHATRFDGFVPTIVDRLEDLHLCFHQQLLVHSCHLRWDHLLMMNHHYIHLLMMNHHYIHLLMMNHRLRMTVCCSCTRLVLHSWQQRPM